MQYVCPSFYDIERSSGTEGAFLQVCPVMQVCPPLYNTYLSSMASEITMIAKQFTIQEQYEGWNTFLGISSSYSDHHSSGECSKGNCDTIIEIGKIQCKIFQEINGRALYIGESKQFYEPGYADKEFDESVLRNKELDMMERNHRFRRQAETTEEPEGSGGTTEALLVEDPPGIGLGFILGKKNENS